jgi:hypothetical protein
MTFLPENPVLIALEAQERRRAWWRRHGWWVRVVVVAIGSFLVGYFVIGRHA